MQFFWHRNQNRYDQLEDIGIPISWRIIWCSIGVTVDGVWIIEWIY
jgi:hypothetical protein